MATDTFSTPPEKPARIGRLKITFNVFIQLFALFLMLLMVNYLSFNHYRRWDFSRNHFFALSDKTRHVLAGLKKKVRVVVRFPGASEIAADTDTLLEEYRRVSNGKMDLEIVDPNRNPTRASEVDSIYKFSPEDCIVLDYDGRKKFIKGLDLVDIDMSGTRYGQPPRLVDYKGEEVITAALLEVSDEKPNVLYAITGHGERDISSPDYKIIKSFIGNEHVTVQPLNLQNVDAIPADAGILFFMGPKYDLSDREIKLLDDYWEKKGRLFVMLDPNAQNQTPNLIAFLDAQCVKVENDRVLRVNTAIGELVRYVTADFLDDSPITKNLKGATGLFQGDTQSLTLEGPRAEKANIRLQMLVQADKGYWGEVNYNIGPGDPAPYFRPKQDFGQPLVVVASVEKGALNGVHVDSSRMIVAGNCDFLSGKMLTQENLNFTINSIDWLMDRAELIGITPKTYNTLTLNLTDPQMSALLLTSMLIIPGAAGMFAIGLWWKRRH